MQASVNDVYIPLLTNASRYLVLYGGAGSGKSVFVAQKLVARILTEKGHRILCVRKFAVTLKESVFKQLREIISDIGLSHEFEVNKTDKTLRHKPTGNELICVGMDDPEKLKSIVGITGIWVEEANNLSPDEFDQLDLRLRGETKNYKQIMLSFNPVDERNWLKARFFDDKPSNCTTIRTTYEDNHYIDEEYKLVLESKASANPNYYRIYKLGEWGKLDVQRPYVHNFSREKHVSDRAVFNPRLPVEINLDFNLEPFVCTMCHNWTDAQGMHLHYFREISIPNGDFQEMANRIRDALPPITLASALYTGDATGHRRQLDVRPNVTSWKQMKQLLNIPDARLRVRRANPSVADTRGTINLIFSLHPDLIFHPSMTGTINELHYTEADAEGNILKKDRSKMEQRSDFLDTVRYNLLTFHSDFEKHLPMLQKR